jgi:hypothetical protein
VSSGASFIDTILPSTILNGLVVIHFSCSARVSSLVRLMIYRFGWLSLLNERRSTKLHQNCVSNKVVLRATINVLAIKTLVFQGLSVDLIASKRIKFFVNLLLIALPNPNNHFTSHHIIANHHKSIHHNNTVCIRDSPMMRRTHSTHAIIITVDMMLSLVVERLIELSASHESGERIAILIRGKLRATATRISVTQIPCMRDVNGITNHDTMEID